MSGEYREIPLEELEISKYNVRLRVDPERIEKLAYDIKENGLHEPLVVRREDGKYGVVIGGRRLRAIRLVKERWPDAYRKHFPRGVPCIVKDLDPKEALLYSLSENYHKETLSPDEYGAAIERLKEMGVTEQEIHERIRMTPEEIERAFRVWRAIKEITKEPTKPEVALARPGRPPEKKKERPRKVSRKAIATAAILSRKLSRKGLLREPKDFEKEFVERVSEEGLSTKEIVKVAKKVEEEAEKTGNAITALEKAIREVKTVELVERVILFRKDVIDAAADYAKKKGQTLDDAINELLSAELRRRGYLRRK